MSIVVDRVSQPCQIPASQGGYFEVEGIAHFVATDVTGTMDCPFGHIKSVFLQAIGGSGGSLTVNGRLSFGSVSATVVGEIILPEAGTLTAAKVVGATTVTRDDANYWSLGILNKTGTRTMADNTAALNTTKATGGGTITAYTPFSFTLLSATNQVFTAGSVVEVSFTKTDTAPTMTGVGVLLTYVTAGGDAEEIFVDMQSAVADGVIPRSSDGTITISRRGHTINSGVFFSFRITGHA